MKYSPIIIWIAAIALPFSSISATDMGHHPEGPIFPLSASLAAKLASVDLTIIPDIWWCTQQSSVFSVNGECKIVSKEQGTIILGLPPMTFNLYESHDSYLYPLLKVDGADVEPQLIVNFSLFSFDEYSVYFEGVKINMTVHPWIGDAGSMESLAPQMFERGYEIFWAFTVRSQSAGESHLITFDYQHHESFMNGAAWNDKFAFDLQYALDWFQTGDFNAFISPDYGIDRWLAPQLEISKKHIEPEEVWLAPGEVIHLHNWGLEIGACVWLQTNPATGLLDQNGFYTALDLGEDRVWIDTSIGSSDEAVIHVIDYPTPTPSPRPTYSPAATPTNDPTATPTTNPDPFIDYDLALNKDRFGPGEEFRLTETITSTYPQIIDANHVLAIYMFDQFWFFPMWAEEFHFTHRSVSSGVVMTIILNFTWPDEEMEEYFGMGVIGGLFKPDSWEPYDWDYVVFGWI